MARSRKKTSKKKSAAFRSNLSRRSSANDGTALNDPASGAVARHNPVVFGAPAPPPPPFAPPPPPSFPNNNQSFYPTHMQPGFNHHQFSNYMNPFPNMQFVPGMFFPTNSSYHNPATSPFSSFSTMNQTQQSTSMNPSYFGSFNSNLNPSAAPFFPGISGNQQNNGELIFFFILFVSVEVFEIASVLNIVLFYFLIYCLVLLHFRASSVFSDFGKLSKIFFSIILMKKCWSDSHSLFSSFGC